MGAPCTLLTVTNSHWPSSFPCCRLLLGNQCKANILCGAREGYQISVASKKWRGGLGRRRSERIKDPCCVCWIIYAFRAPGFISCLFIVPEGPAYGSGRRRSNVRVVYPPHFDVHYSAGEVFLKIEATAATPPQTTTTATFEFRLYLETQFRAGIPAAPRQATDRSHHLRLLRPKTNIFSARDAPTIHRRHRNTAQDSLWDRISPK